MKSTVKILIIVLLSSSFSVICSKDRCTLISHVCLADADTAVQSNFTGKSVFYEWSYEPKKLLPDFLSFKYKRSFEFNDMREMLPNTDLIKRHDLLVLLGKEQIAFTYRIRINSPTLSNYLFQGIQAGVRVEF